MVFGVYVRTRPVGEGVDEGAITKTSDIPDYNVVWNTENKSVRKYGRIDGILPTDSQTEVYNMLAKTYVERALKGGNGVIISYGRSGSGKTYTMFGNPSGDKIGVLPQFITDLYDEIAKRPVNTYAVLVSQVEIVSDVVLDVIASKTAKDQTAEAPSTIASLARTLLTANSMRRGSKVHVRHPQAPSTAHKYALEIMEVQGEEGFYILQGLNRFESSDVKEVLNVVSDCGIVGTGHSVVTVTVVNKIEGTQSMIHFVDLNGQDIGSTEPRRGRTDISTLVELLHAHALGTNMEVFRASTLTKIIHSEMKSTDLVRVVLCTEPRHGIHALDLASYFVGQTTYLVHSGLPYEVSCVMDALAAELQTYKDAVKQYEYLRSARKLSFQNTTTQPQVATISNTINSPTTTGGEAAASVISRAIHSAGSRSAITNAVVEESRHLSRQIVQLEAALKQSKRDYAALQEESKAQMAILETKCKKLSEKSLKLRDEKEKQAAQIAQMESKFQEKWKSREGEIANEINTLSSHAQTIVDKLNEEKKKAPQISVALLRAAKDKEAITSQCKEVERRSFQRQLDATVTSCTKAAEEMKSMYEKLLREANGKINSLETTLRRESVKYKHDVQLCKAEIEYLFEYARAVTKVIQMIKLKSPFANIPTPTLEWDYLNHVRGVLKKVVMWLRENHNWSTIKDVERCFDVDKYPLAFVPPIEDVDHLKHILNERDQMGLL